jgi:hypothetical protein
MNLPIMAGFVARLARNSFTGFGMDSFFFATAFPLHHQRPWIPRSGRAASAPNRLVELDTFTTKNTTSLGIQEKN